MTETQLRTIPPFEMEITVAEDDIDRMGHVNNIVYLRWVQDVAVAHWNAAATAEQKRSLLWVVARHEIDYKRPAFAGDVLILRTFVGKAVRNLFVRHTEILRKKDGKLLARARTLWVPVDPITKKAKVPGNDVYAMFSTQV